MKILVSSLKTESDFEEKLKKFYEDRELKILILQFLPNETDKMNLLKFAIENDEKDKKKKIKDKLFVFVVYLYRIEKQIKINNMQMRRMQQRNKTPEQLRRENEEKQREENARKSRIIQKQNLISHLSDFNQIFIDNLNGINVSIDEILNISNENIFQNKLLIDLDEVIKQNTFNSFSSIRYIFKNKIGNLENNKYQKEITEKINKNEEFKIKIKNSIHKEIQKAECIYFTLLKDPYGIQKDDIDFISSLQKYQIYIIRLYLIKIIVKCEREHVLSFLLEEKNLQNEILKKIFDDYFEKLDLSEEKPNLEMNGNEIEVLFGLRIPGIKPIFEKILLYVNELKDEFFLNEENIRNNKHEGEELVKEQNNYRIKQDIIINKVVGEFKKHKLFLDLEEKENEQKLNEEIINYIIEDYLIMFLGVKFDCDYLYLIKMLNLIIKLRYGDEKEKLLKQISKIIIYLESNSKYIYIILEMFNMIFEYKKNHYELIEEVIKDNKINYEISERNPECKKEVNYDFYIIFEALIQPIFNMDFFIDIEHAIYYDFVRKCNNILQNANVVEMNLRLFSKNIF